MSLCVSRTTPSAMRISIKRRKRDSALWLSRCVVSDAPLKLVYADPHRSVEDFVLRRSKSTLTVQQPRLALSKPRGFVRCGESVEVRGCGRRIIHPLAQQLAPID